jgi:hypothetical protein
VSELWLNGAGLELRPNRPESKIPVPWTSDRTKPLERYLNHKLIFILSTYSGENLMKESSKAHFTDLKPRRSDWNKHYPARKRRPARCNRARGRQLGVMVASCFCNKGATNRPLRGRRKYHLREAVVVQILQKISGKNIKCRT